MRVESDATDQIKSVVDVSNSGLTVNGSPEKPNGHFDGYNNYGDNVGNIKSNSPENDPTAPLMVLNADNLANTVPNMGPQVNSQLCPGAPHSPGWEAGGISDAYSSHSQATPLEVETEKKVKSRSDKDSSNLEVRYKIQRVTDQFLGNEWLQATQAYLIISLWQHVISENVFWSKMSEVHYPLEGNGLADIGDGKHPIQTGDCLYTVAILATESYSQVAVDAEYEAQFLKKGTILQFRNIVQHFHAPARPTGHADSETYLVRRDTLLGQLLHALSRPELELYAESMEKDALHPAGPLDICVMSHLMKKDIQVYRQVDAPQEQTSNPVLAKCLDTLSNAEQSFRIFLHKGHFMPLPEVLPPTTVHRISRSYLDAWPSGGPFESLWLKIRELLINTSRADYLQHDHWGVMLSSATSLGLLGLRELMYLSIVNLGWKGAANQAMRLMGSLTFRTSQLLKLVIPASIQRCGTGNLRLISL